MNLQKRFEYAVGKLNLQGFMYIHKMDEKTKWENFKKKKHKKCLEELLILEEKNQRNKYYNKRLRQFSNIAKLLLLNDNFIEDVLKLSKIFQLDKLAFGLKKTDITFITDKSRKKYANVPDDYLFYDFEIKEQCIALWKCWLDYFSIKYLKKYKHKIDFEKNSELRKDNVYYRNIPFIKFFTMLNELLKKYNLSNLWEDSIQLLLLTGKLFIPDEYCPVMVKKDKDEITISIPIYQETQLEDIKHKWEDIRHLKNEYYSKTNIKSSKGIDIYLDIIKKKKKGIRYWDLIDFEKLEIPFDAKEEMKAYERIRKGSFRIRKASEDLKKYERKEKHFVETFAEHIGLDKLTFKL